MHVRFVTFWIYVKEVIWMFKVVVTVENGRCPICGTKVSEDDDKCPICGVNLESKVT